MLAAASRHPNGYILQVQGKVLTDDRVQDAAGRLKQ
jgi:hypothetical protein